MSITATRSTGGIMHCSLNFRARCVPMLFVMNAIAQASAAALSGPKLDNRRVLAALVDLAIVVAGSVVILFAADALSGDNSEIRGALGAVILGWALYYYFAMESGDGQTVGKKLMKLRVVLADGRPAGMREVAVRTVLRVIDGIGLYIVGLIVMLVTGERRQRLGDLAGGTMVVDASATSYSPPAPAPAPVEETVVEDEPVEDEVVEPVEDVVVEPVEDEYVAPVEAEIVEDEDEGVEHEYVAAVEVVGSDEPVEDEVVAAVEVVGSDEPVEDEVVEESTSQRSRSSGLTSRSRRGRCRSRSSGRRAGRGRARRAGCARGGRGRVRLAGHAGAAGRGRAGRGTHGRRGRGRRGRARRTAHGRPGRRAGRGRGAASRGLHAVARGTRDATWRAGTDRRRGRRAR